MGIKLSEVEQMYKDIRIVLTGMKLAKTGLFHGVKVHTSEKTTQMSAAIAARANLDSLNTKLQSVSSVSDILDEDS